MTQEILNFLSTSISSALLVGTVIWLSRTWIKERLTASIHLETEGELTRLRADLDSANQRIRDLSSVASSANQHVESSLLNHRIAATQLIWATIQNWQKVTTATMMISAIPDDWLKRHASDRKTKEMFDDLLGNIDLQAFLENQNKSLLVRPFLPESTWALYFALHSFEINRISKVMLLRISGIDHYEIISRMNAINLVTKSAPPEILATYKNDSFAGSEPYLHYLREEILRELRDMLSGHRASTQALQNASEILKAAEALSFSTAKAVQTQQQA